MGVPLVSVAHLSPTTRARVAACGHPLTFVADGKAAAGRWSCGSTWCRYCSGRRRERARKAIGLRIDVERPVMVTLTIPHRPDLSASYLRAQCELLAATWRGAMSRVRWGVHLARRHQPNPWAMMRPPGRGGPHPQYASTWDGGWKGDCAAGVWVREVTMNRGAHVHAHVIVRTRADAEMLNAAWQAEVQSRGLVRSGYWVQTDFTELDSDRAAGYVAKYLTKGDATKLRPAVQGAYVEGTKGMRRADAWGDWRPLGLAMRKTGDATHVAAAGWSYAVDIPTYYGESGLGRWLRTGRPPYDGPLPRVVQSLLAETDDEELLAESRLAALAAAKSLGKCVQLAA